MKFLCAVYLLEAKGVEKLLSRTVNMLGERCPDIGIVTNWYLHTFPVLLQLRTMNPLLAASMTAGARKGEEGEGYFLSGARQ